VTNWASCFSSFYSSREQELWLHVVSWVCLLSAHCYSCAMESQLSSVPFHLHLHSCLLPTLGCRCSTFSASFLTTVMLKLLTVPFYLWESLGQVCVMVASKDDTLNTLQDALCYTWSPYKCYWLTQNFTSLPSRHHWPLYFTHSSVLLVWHPRQCSKLV